MKRFFVGLFSSNHGTPVFVSSHFVILLLTGSFCAYWLRGSPTPLDSNIVGGTSLGTGPQQRSIVWHGNTNNGGREVPEESLCQYSTEDLYAKTRDQLTMRDTTEGLFWKPPPSSADNLHQLFQQVRESLDYDYHHYYSIGRQQYQNEIMGNIMSGDQSLSFLQHETSCAVPKQQWLVFTAGPMGSGKSHTLRWLERKGYFPLSSFVVVDPDHIRHLLREYPHYVQNCPEYAGFRTHKEVGMMAEIITKASLIQQKNVVVDGTLRDSQWYRRYIEQLRHEIKTLQGRILRVAILHVTAPSWQILERAQHRAEQTGRVVPREKLLQTIRMVPQSVQQLRDEVDIVIELDNSSGRRQEGTHSKPESDNIRITSPVDMDWEVFKNLWH